MNESASHSHASTMTMPPDPLFQRAHRNRVLAAIRGEDAQLPLASKAELRLIIAAAPAILAALVAAARCAPVARGCAARLRADTRVGPPEAPHGSLAGTASTDRDGQARAQGSGPPPARAQGWPIGRRHAALYPPPYSWHPPICFLRASVRWLQSSQMTEAT
jgi:hypothetical protein